MQKKERTALFWFVKKEKREYFNRWPLIKHSNIKQTEQYYQKFVLTSPCFEIYIVFVKKEERNDLYKTYINWNKNEVSTRFWTGTLQSAPKSVSLID